MKKLSFIYIMFLILNLVFTLVHATSKIPEQMDPDTLIKYVDENDYIILDEKEKENCEYNENDFVEIESLIQKTKEDIFVEEYPSPGRGMFVQYGSDGMINIIYVSKKEEKNFITIDDKSEDANKEVMILEESNVKNQNDHQIVLEFIVLGTIVILLTIVFKNKQNK